MDHPVMIVTESWRRGGPCWTVTEQTGYGRRRHTFYNAGSVWVVIYAWEGIVKFRVSAKVRKAARGEA